MDQVRGPRLDLGGRNRFALVTSCGVYLCCGMWGLVVRKSRLGYVCFPVCLCSTYLPLLIPCSASQLSMGGPRIGSSPRICSLGNLPSTFHLMLAVL